MNNNTKYICTYPFYRSFSAGSVYDENDLDKMTNTPVKVWAEENPNHWLKLNNK